MSSKKSFFIKLSCALGAFVLGFAFALMPFFSSKTSYALNSNQLNMHNLSNLNYQNKFFGENFDYLTSLDASKIVNFGNNTVYIAGQAVYYILNKETNIWSDYIFPGSLSRPQTATAFWTDYLGNSYYSNEGSNYFYNGSTWVTVSFSGDITVFNGIGIYTFSDKTLMFFDGSWYTLDADSRSWALISIDDSSITNVGSFVTINAKVVNDKLFYKGLTVPTGGSSLRVLQDYTFVEIPSFTVNGTAECFWTDGYYWYFNSSIFNFEDYSLTTVNWSLPSFMSSVVGSNIWTDGTFIYYSNNNNQNAVCYNNFYYSGYNNGYDIGYNAGYNQGYIDGIEGTTSETPYDRGYEAGYAAGVATNSGYSNGYNTGYNLGYNEGYSVGSSSGYNTGYNTGSTDGYNQGYNAGIEEGTDYSFLSLMGAVIDAPIKAFTGLFDFELFGTNIKNLLLALFTGSVIIVILKFSLGGGK